MKKISAIFLSLSLFIASCEKEQMNIQTIEAEVLGPDYACGYYAIKITQGIQEVRSIIKSTEFDSTFVAKNLPTQFETVGLKLILAIRKPQENELGACNTIGVSYPWLFVKSAKRKE